mmetsp:Transcript_6535/g.11281  ORF Transcript_6535/g.11281 Transcript_6535/m.11281 type:complete len:291 (+) Transcript_6535:1727-2599(+)
MRLLVAPNDVLQSGRDEEVLLLEAQLLALRGAVVRVQHRRERLCALLLEDGRDIVAGVEALDVELVCGLGGPEAQVDDVGRVPSRDGVVVCHRFHLFARIPPKDVASINFMSTHVTIKLYCVRHIWAHDFPRITKVQPVVRRLALKPLAQCLSEHPVLVSNSVAPRREVLGCHRVQEARSQPAEAAIAERGVALLLRQNLHIVSKLCECFSVRILDAQVVRSVEERAPREELHGEVIDPFRIFLAEVLLRVVPALDEAVAHAKCGGLVCFKVVESVTASSDGILDVVDDA